ncbi:uncharacterized protein FIESC28_05827 [Fusarium coffeatum]|uniref:2EXR domain-containing protein n=1 Tax=Fusarium coffeatum TaxID=231269 RepID=A0A366RRF8_9HYPO|nr:uncharacterized protein FIESC28_05827 [Fusarium coffeatum]RBR18905.1 hypothetical protein FIESC28_05827 [Fusarium coffeatum]
MSAQTFHRFPDLPYELRHHVSEASCFDRHEERHGLHYVDCPGSRKCRTRIECRAASETETSACLMDAGLWAACQESRRVIKKQMRQHGFLRTDRENKSLCLKGPEPATLIIDENEDMVCFRISDWFKVQHWTKMFHFLLSYADSTEEGMPHNVAFEMDGSWDHQHSIWRAILNGIRFYGGGHYPPLYKHIIDKKIHWFRDSSTLDDTWADCNNEFMVVTWKNLCPCNQRGMDSGALVFLMYMRRGYQPYTSDGYHSCMGLYHTAYTLAVDILVRQDNEVMPCQSCQTRAKKDHEHNYLLDGMDLPLAEEDEKVEESKEEERESEKQ